MCKILFGQPRVDIQFLSKKDVPSLKNKNLIQKKFCELGRVHTDGSQSKILWPEKKSLGWNTGAFFWKAN